MIQTITFSQFLYSVVSHFFYFGISQFLYFVKHKYCLYFDTDSVVYSVLIQIQLIQTLIVQV